jgi:hypothetical protein
MHREILAKFVSFRDEKDYPSDTMFTQQQLSPITPPSELKRWMQLKVRGTADPDEDANLAYGCLSSLEFYKKAISHCMPHRFTPWDPITERGNPTRSVETSEPIKATTKKEV